MNKNNINLEIHIEGVPARFHNHDNKIFIEAKEGREFSIILNNQNSGRVLSVVSVDGLSVLTGEPCSKDSQGYVINGKESLKIEGFRYSQEKVASFKFSKKEKSYAAENNNGCEVNCGVIAAAIYFEITSSAIDDVFGKWKKVLDYPDNDWEPFQPHKPIWPKYPPYNPYPVYPRTPWEQCPIITRQTVCSSDNHQTYGQTRKFTSQTSSKLENNIKSDKDYFDLGTTWGVAKESKVEDVKFERGIIAAKFEIYYASRESLLKMGINLDEKGIKFPEAFPAKYAKAPKNWKE